MKRIPKLKIGSVALQLFVIIISLFFISPYSFAATFNGATVNSAQTICSGSTPSKLTLSISTCKSSSSYTISAYEWQSSNDNSTWAKAIGGSGVTTSSYTPPSLTATKYYRCKITVTGTCTGITSPYNTASVQITVNSATAITSNPSNQSVCAGSTATFIVLATGTSLTYQWQSCATATGTYSSISGATSTSYAVNASPANNGYYYKCQVSGSCGAAKTSNYASLTVNSLPSITSNPSDQSVCLGSTATFSVSATGSGLTYQWQKSGSIGMTIYNNTPISGATSSSYSFTPSLDDNNFTYRCIVSNSCSATSNPATLRVSSPLNFSYTSSKTSATYDTSLCSGEYTSATIDITNRAGGESKSVPGLEYNYSLLSSDNASAYARSFYNEFLYSCTEGSYSKILHSFKLVAVLNTGDVFNYGTQTAFNASVHFLVADKTTGGNLLNKDITLSINQNTPEQVYIEELDPSIIKFLEAGVTIQSVSVANRVQDNIQLKVYFDVDYGVNLGDADIVSTTAISGSVSDNPVTLNWTSSSTETIPGYQLQIMRLFNQNSGTDYQGTRNIYTTIDWSKALNIETESSASSLTLTLAEGSGYYVWRIRPIGNYYEGGIADSRNWGAWNADAPADGDHVDITNGDSKTFSLTASQRKYLFYYDQFDADKNWIFNRVFTEQNKNAEGISYANGLGQLIQSQRKLNEQDSILAGESIYDNVGRPAIQTMTAPVNQNSLGFIEKLVRNEGDSLYGTYNFDSDKRKAALRYPICLPVYEGNTAPQWEHPDSMYGAISKFYSDSNPDINIPSAGFYPFARTLYHKDGRVKKQTLFGDEHKLGLYDETYIAGGMQRAIRTYYSAVSDSELLAVFGNETPADTNIYKITRVDPNEMPSIEYKSVGGQTLATCLINTGDHPLLQDISENRDTIYKEIKGQVEKEPGVFVKEQVINFSDPTVQINIDYNLTKDDFDANCIDYCNTCDYHVELYIIREETDTKIWGSEIDINPFLYDVADNATDANGELTGINPNDPSIVSADRCLTIIYDPEASQGNDDNVTDSEICNAQIFWDNSEMVIMLSDPGNYRIGRKIYTGEYRDYEDTTIANLLDVEAEKFDDLMSYVDTAQESPSLTNFYSYINNLSSGSSSICDENRRTFNITGRTNILESLGSGSSKGDGTAASPTNDGVWLVSKVQDDVYDTIYTLASSCMEIQVPYIDCNFNPADLIKVTEDQVSSPEDWEQNLFAANKDENGVGYYYDFEGMLTEMWGSEDDPNIPEGVVEKQSDNLLTDASGTTLGSNLYQYFFDKNGEAKYSINMTARTAELTLTNDASNYDDYDESIDGYQDVRNLMINSDGDSDESNDISFPDYFLWNSVTGEPIFSLNIMNGDNEVVNIVLTIDELGLRDQCSTISVWDADEGTSYNNFSALNFQTYVQAIADKLTEYGITNTGLGTPDYDSGDRHDDILNISIGNLTITNFSFEINGIQYDLNPDLEISFSQASTSNLIAFSQNSEFYINDDNSAAFATSNGAFNTMIMHMLNEKVQTATGEDSSLYESYDLYLIWEQMVRSWPDFYYSRGSSTMPSGRDALEEFVELAGERYTGFSNHAYGVGDENAFLNDENGGMLGGMLDDEDYHYIDYGYGYLEYAYKSFPYDIEEDEWNVNCATTYGVYPLSPISDWTNPPSVTAVDDQGEIIPDSIVEIWSTDECRENAWYNSFTTSINADDPAYPDTSNCNIWKQLYGCLNSEYSATTTTAMLDASYDSAYVSRARTTDESGVSQMAYWITERAKDVAYKRLQGISSKIYDLYPGRVNKKAEVELSAMQYIDEKLIPYITVNPVYDPTDGTKVLKLGKNEEIEFIGKIHSSAIDVSASSEEGKEYVAIQTFSFPQVAHKYLNFYLRNKTTVTNTEIENVLTKALERSNISANDISSYRLDALINNLSFSCSNSSNIHNRETAENTASVISFTLNSDNKIVLNYGNNSDEILDLSTLTGLDKNVTSLPYFSGFGSNFAIEPTIAKTLHLKSCDERNYTYLTNLINYQLAENKDCRLSNSMAEYDRQCTRKANIKDELVISYSIDYHHYTLFYYDMAGNLVKTVPPAGVDMFQSVDGSNPSRNDVKNHTLLTKYKYNSLGQRTYEESPDGGIKQFWYNSIGQLRFSQNAQQAQDGKYAYLKYDELGRIIESGISTQSVSGIDNFTTQVDVQEFPNSTAMDGTASTFLSEQNYTVYTTAASNGTYIDGTTEQENILNRISYTYTSTNIRTIYSYDSHGNVKWIKSVLDNFAPKYMKYEYDLITGKVTEVKYNEGMQDQFFHRYTYDSDNRIKAVETSRDGVIWDVDAHYEYYAYGPLKRLSIGNDNVQGLDYVWTINGWLKAVNHQSLDPENDPGHDGADGSTYGRDVFGYTLGYFDGDFKRGINNDGNDANGLDEFSAFNSEYSDPSSEYFSTGKMQQSPYLFTNSDPTGSSTGIEDYQKVDQYRPLFNGTITSIVNGTASTNGGFTIYDNKVTAYKCKYDELYRLVETTFDYYDEANNKWADVNNTGNPIAQPNGIDIFANTSTVYKTKYAYDAMGNIDSLVRFDGNGNYMDTLFYTYNTDANGNKLNTLNHIDEFEPTIGITTDLEDQDEDNYLYDLNGQLTQDEKEGITNINWNAAGLVSRVEKNNDVDADADIVIEFTYDAMNNRVVKKVTTEGNEIITHYVRDATGNVMGVYETTNAETADATTTFKEASIYAGSRMGMSTPNLALSSSSDNDAYTSSDNKYTRTLGEKSYELSDHLGNVRAVVSDVKNPDDNTTIADLQSATDYYPYGMAMPGRDYSSSDYRYGYQGKEKDNELKGNGNSYDFGARLLDPRVGRWLSLDPLAEKYLDQSPYISMDDNPICLTDPTGMGTKEQNNETVITFMKVVGESAHIALEILEADGAHMSHVVMKFGTGAAVGVLVVDAVQIATNPEPNHGTNVRGAGVGAAGLGLLIGGSVAPPVAFAALLTSIYGEHMEELEKERQMEYSEKMEKMDEELEQLEDLMRAAKTLINGVNADYEAKMAVLDKEAHTRDKWGDAAMFTDEQMNYWSADIDKRRKEVKKEREERIEKIWEAAGEEAEKINKEEE